ncbi:hypothetical protein Y032_0002g1067 [Ancylostoma ceylanicum]|nr:hypothetical protein Y032_0002g1067 [Ancylostoma ceylanicum]
MWKKKSSLPAGLLIPDSRYLPSMNIEDPGAIVRSLTLYIVEGSTAAALNIPLVIAMLTNKTLRIRREYQVMIGISVVNIVFGTAFVLSGVNRMAIIQENFYTGFPLIPRWVCSTRYYVHLLTMAYQLQGVLILTVAIDRLLAIMTPIKYLKFDTRYTIITATGPYFFVVFCTMVNAIITLQDDTPVTPFCLTDRAVSKGFYYFILFLRIGCVFISALIYVVITAQLNKQFARMEKLQVAGRESSQFRSIRRSTITVALSTVNAVILLLVPDVIKYTGIFDHYRSYVVVLNSLSMTNVVLAALIFAYRHKEIRSSLRMCLCTLLHGSTAKVRTSDVVCRVMPSRRTTD